MSFPRYPEYKDSGVGWLGLVPSHWPVMRLRQAARLNPSKSETAALPRSTLVTFLPMEAIGEDGSLALDRVRAIGELESGYTYFSEGDVAIAKITPCFENGKGAVMRGLHGGLGFGTTELIVARPLPQHLDGTYLHRIFTSRPFMQQGEASMYGAGGQKRVPDDFVRDFAIALPPVEEQVVINHFLDRETAKIDALVAEQEQLITLLKEKRQAVISHAVTKGLDPSVPMKDSGVEWLGVVPAHWDVHGIKHIVSTPITDGPHESPAFPDEGIPFVSAEAVSTGVIDFDRIRGFISEEDHARYSLKYKPKRGDIFMVKSGATTGVTAMVDTDMDFNIWSPLAVIRAAAFMSPHYVLQFMRSLNFQEAVTLNWSFGTQQNIGMGVIENLSIAVPPLAEQEAISGHLRQLLDQFQPLISEATQAIQLLQERRSALISAAVTGQIDVRGLALAKEAA